MLGIFQFLNMYLYLETKMIFSCDHNCQIYRPSYFHVITTGKVIDRCSNFDFFIYTELEVQNELHACCS